MDDVETSFLKLKEYLEKEGFSGWDPYDGLNSQIVQKLGLSQSKFARILLIQFFKRSKFANRNLFRIPKGRNPKGLALLLSGYCNLYYIANSGNEAYGSPREILIIIEELSEALIELSNRDHKGYAWGYDFDWQSKAFFLPKGTPTVVATSFVVDSLCSANLILKSKLLERVIIDSANFVLNSLNRLNSNDGAFMFSYSPIDNRAVYNAALLGAKILCQVYNYTKNEELLSIAKANIEAVCAKQNLDGSFPHSDQVGDKWRDSFHTAFKLECIDFFNKVSGDKAFLKNYERGIDYWEENFFDMENGYSYYYDRNQRPDLVDLHCLSQALVLFCLSGRIESRREGVTKLIQWAIRNMQDTKGYFYFQKTKFGLNKLEYFRWPNAWMFYGMSFYILEKYDNQVT